MKKFLLLLLLISAITFGQPPNISYTGVQPAYLPSSTIALSPTNTGGQPTHRTSVTTQSGTQAASYIDGNPGSYVWVVSVAISPSGILYGTDDYFPTIRKVLPDGTVSTLAGKHIVDTNGWIQYGYVDGQGEDAEFNNPKGLSVSSSGDIYVCDTYNHINHRPWQ